jgi:hypothetical protein
VAARATAAFDNGATPAVTALAAVAFVVTGRVHMKANALRAATLAVLFATVQLVACGGGGGDDDDDVGAAPPPPVAAPPAQPQTISPLKALTYDVLTPTGSTDLGAAGAVSAPTASGATLSLGALGQTVLGVDTNGGFHVTSNDYLVVSRANGSVLMLCDATQTPGTSPARVVAVASSVAEGGLAATAVTDATQLAGQRFFKMADCTYVSGAGSQAQNDAATAETLTMDVDASGNMTSNAFTATFTAAEFSALLAGGATIDGSQFTAWRIVDDGVSSYVLVERGYDDPVNQIGGYVKLWLPE